jgi:hypothetical protein
MAAKSKKSRETNKLIPSRDSLVSPGPFSHLSTYQCTPSGERKGPSAPFSFALNFNTMIKHSPVGRVGAFSFEIINGRNPYERSPG